MKDESKQWMEQMGARIARYLDQVAGTLAKLPEKDPIVKAVTVAGMAHALRTVATENLGPAQQLVASEVIEKMGLAVAAAIEQVLSDEHLTPEQVEAFAERTADRILGRLT